MGPNHKWLTLSPFFVLGHDVCVLLRALQEELRMTAAALLNDLAEALGFDLCKQFVTPEMESLSEV